MTTSTAPQRPFPSHPPHSARTDTRLPSLLDEPPAPVAPPAPPRAHSPSREAIVNLGERVRRNKGIAVLVAGIMLIGMGLGLYLALRPTPQPDFLDDDMDLVLDYALLSDDFNNLPLEQRLKLITDLVERLKNMSSGDSAMMAAFATTIEQKARKQLSENMSRLAIDIWDNFAVKYDGVDSANRGEFLDDTFIQFTKMMESIGGETSKKTDEQRLEEVHRQAERDRKNVESGKFNPPAQALGRVFEFMNFEVGGHASPQQRSRGQLMMRDMVRHFRGEEVDSEGKPKAPPTRPKPPAPKPGEEPAKPGEDPAAPGAPGGGPTDPAAPGEEPEKPADKPEEPKPAEPKPGEPSPGAPKPGGPK